MSKRWIIRTIALIYLAAMIFGLWGFAVGRYESFPAEHVDPMIEEVSAFFDSVPEDNRNALEKLRLHRQERRPRFEESGFILKDSDFQDSGYLLLSYFDRRQGQVMVDLVRIRGFEVLHQWKPPLEVILEDTETDLQDNSKDGYRAQHPLLLKGGSLVFTSGEGPLVRIDAESNVEWIVKEHFHHSIEQDAHGNLVVPMWIKQQKVDLPFDIRDDGYAVVSLEGEILEARSAANMLMENGFIGLLLGVGTVHPDRIHLNDAQPIHKDLGLAKKGDVALSSRSLSTVWLYRPATDEIVWLKTGPWLKQHDVNLLDDGTFSIFGNDVIFDNQGYRRIEPISQVYFYDPESGRVETPFTKILLENGMITDTEGRSRILENGDLFIEETNSQRLLRLSKDHVRWQFVNTQSKNSTGALHWCRYLAPDEVDLSWLPQ